ncbi:site-specific integrase, partial [Enterococcus devriesei]
INEYAKTHEKQTTQDFHHQVKGAILDAVDDGLLQMNPTRKVTIKGKEPREKKIKFLSVEELKRLVGTLECKNEINWDWFIVFVAKTGLRFAEALAVTPADFDLNNQTLSINKTWEYKKSNPKFQPTKNSSSVRKIKLDWQMIGQFCPLIANLPQDELIFVEKEKNGKYKRVFNSTVNKFLERKCIEADVPIITVHALRHTHASILLLEGVTMHSIADRLGHANVTTTQETYTHIIKELEKKDEQKMIGALSAIA